MPPCYDDVVRVRDALRAWGVQAGIRVGIYAPNSYHWLVHDLALIELGAISVPFTDDFAGKVNQALLDQYNIALLLIAKAMRACFRKSRPMSLLSMPTMTISRALDRPPSGDAG